MTIASAITEIRKASLSLSEVFIEIPGVAVSKPEIGQLRVKLLSNFAIIPQQTNLARFCRG